MANKYDFEGLRTRLHSHMLGHLQHWLPDGKVEQHEYVATNPTRNDKKKGSFKINLRNGKWSDFASGDKGGDLISLYAYLKGCDNGEAYRELSGESHTNDFKKREQTTKKKTLPPEDTFEPMDPPENVPMPSYKGKPERVAIYKDASGKPIVRVVIYRINGNKTPVPTSYGRRRWAKMNTLPDGSEEWSGDFNDRTQWHRKHWPANRPIYNLDKLAQNPAAPVLIGEGEKVCQVLEGIFQDEFVCSTWPGGSKAISKADFSAIKDRKVILCPDYDVTGQKAMLDLAKILKKQGCKVSLVWEMLDEQRHDDGWDLADEPDADKVRSYVNGAIPLELVENMILESKDADVKDGGVGQAYTGMADSLPLEVLRNQKELRCLGFGNDNKVYFISRKRGVVVGLTPSDLGNLNNMMSFMPMTFWYDLFPNKKGGIDKNIMSDVLQRWADETGYFNPDIIRGAGIWFEGNGDVVFHMGQRLLVNDRVISPNEYQSEYMYEATNDLGVRHTKPLSTEEAKKLLGFVKWLNWDCPIYANLLAGFCVVAPICGGLEWRPHIWVTGSAGTGKSTVMTDIVRRMCGKVCLHVLGDSTAAGIRQRLGSDALPVIFDEFEGESQQRLQELQRTIDLARQASSESGAAMLKGSMGGSALEFKVRSCFAFSAINVNVTHYADKTRISVLTLADAPDNLTKEQAYDRADKFNEWITDLRKTLSPEYVNAMQMRAFALLPVIRKNAKVFGRAVSTIVDSTRIGDQLGILIAGSFALESSKEVSEEEAEAWVNKQDWTMSAPTDDAKDHDRCLSYILQHTVRVNGDRGVYEKTLGELLEQIASPTNIDTQPLEQVLIRNGLKVDRKKNVLCVANQHTHLEKILSSTPYNSWNRLLMRLKGAESSGGAIRFGKSVSSRAVLIPLDTILSSGDDKTSDGMIPF